MMIHLVCKHGRWPRVLLSIVATLVLCGTERSTLSADTAAKPNVLFIAIDDLNDWVGCLAGHPDVKTPHMDRLARRGVLFANAHCPAPVCNPCRTALLSGVLPSTSGCYQNADWWSESPALRGAVPLPMHFKNRGYRTMTVGKIFHNGPRSVGKETWNAMWDENGGGGSAHFSRDEDFFPGLANIHRFAIFWGPRDFEFSDTQTAAWAAERLEKDYNEPFLLTVGFHRPHVPLTAPPQYFEMYDRRRIALPPVREGDLDDMPWMARQSAIAGFQDMEGGYHFQMTRLDYWRDAVQAYLACVSFVDDCVGQVLDALDSSPHAHDTIVVLWSDHGWGLGEHYHWQKWGLWDVTTRVPLIISAPGVTAPGGRCDAPAGLVDLYPTLVDLCGLTDLEQLEGESLRPLLEDPNADRTRPALTTMGPNNHTLRTERWRYTRYADGSQELYDHQSDPHEWHNLAEKPEHAEIIRQLRKWLPTRNANAVKSTPSGDTIHLERGQPVPFHAVQPNVAGRSITVRAEIQPESPNGVIVCHAGMYAGYALYLKGGKLCMSVMDVPRPLAWDKLLPERTVVACSEPLPDGLVCVEGRLDADGRITLKVNGKLAGQGQCDGPLSIHPTGVLQLGAPHNDYLAVGDYGPEDRFEGLIRNAVVRFGD